MDDNECPDCPQLPGWLATFADLMSLLMCFFVLLLSFSEMDVQKYKRVAGSMKFAFGVQREVSAKQIPKGTSIIAQEFSAGKPTPTIVKSVQQVTTEQYKQNLDFNDSDTRTNKSSGEEESGDQSADTAESKESSAQSETEVTEEFTESQLQVVAEVRAQALYEGQMMAAAEIARELAAEEMQTDTPVRLSDGQLKKRLEQEAERRAESKAERVRRSLKDEIEEGLVEVVTDGDKVIVRLRERGFFNTARAKINEQFTPVLARVGRALGEVPGDLVVAGHTDNVPISNDEFRSNWELSAARAANVVHYLTTRGGIAKGRVEMRAHAEVKPLADNTTAENRARNRRVDVVVLDGVGDRG